MRFLAAFFIEKRASLEIMLLRANGGGGLGILLSLSLSELGLRNRLAFLPDIIKGPFRVLSPFSCRPQLSPLAVNASPFVRLSFWADGGAPLVAFQEREGRPPDGEKRPYCREMPPPVSPHHAKLLRLL